ncbi:hypothetical protein L596_029813 [Steinernema carpocapsae]|uniref:Mediator of RNA polymerase II transcription subunit 10 n=1 Tax=Steinernema carpocapsae TaxID=34508 RepID=A0A4U5LQW9_STECR|nr:hypothetical protein L596_029813 [Steinernema carpocapsae]
MENGPPLPNSRWSAPHPYSQQRRLRVFLFASSSTICAFLLPGIRLPRIPFLHVPLQHNWQLAEREGRRAVAESLFPPSLWPQYALSSAAAARSTEEHINCSSLVGGMFPLTTEISNVNDVSLSRAMDNNSQQPSSDFPDKFVRLERTLEQIQENVRQLGVIASDFNSKSQEPFNQRLQTLISGLQELDNIKNQFSDVKVPLGLLECINNGKNPNVFDRETLRQVESKNADVNGKIERYKKFHAFLIRENAEEMPREVEKYLQSRPEVTVAITEAAADGCVKEESERMD